MWFIKSWIYKSRYGSLPFKMRNFTESYQEECRELIKDEFKAITAKLPHIWTRLQLKDPKGQMLGYYKNIFGDKIPVKHPIFSENEVAGIRKKMGIYFFTLFLMVFFESVLYSMMANLFIKKQVLKDYPGIDLLFGFAFALIFVIALHFAFKSLWSFFEAKHHIEIENLDVKRLKPFYKNLILSILIIIIFVITNLYTGFIRATILEPGSSASGSSFVEKIHGPLLIFSISITFVVALVMALIEKGLVEKMDKYHVFENWKRQQRERKVYNTQVKDMLKKCIDRKNILIDKYWGVMKDLQRVFEVEVDADRESLYTELNTKIANNEIDLLNIDEVTYQKYLPVAITRHELFEYGISTDKGINETIDDLKVKVAKIEEFEKRNAADGNGKNDAEKPNEISA